MRTSRQDYEEIVRVIRRLEKGKTKRIMWGLALAEVLRRSNPLFDKKRFVGACSEEEKENA